jgi:hypothetical protein
LCITNQEEAKVNAVEVFKRIAVQFPEANPKLTEFPSGAAMLDITIREVRYCAEYLPSFNAYGLSKTEGATPFWEGVEESFKSAEQLEAKVREMMKIR